MFLNRIKLILESTGTIVMDTNRWSEWINSSFCLAQIEPFMIIDAQGLGMLDAELVEEYANLNAKYQSEQDLLKRNRHFVVSRLWVIGAYELVRSIDERIEKINDRIGDETRKKLAETLTNFTKLRIPLAKFQTSGKKERQIARPIWFPSMGVGWKLENDLIFSRKNLGDSLLELLNLLKRDISAKDKIT